VATADDIFRLGLAAHQSGDLGAAEQHYRQLLDAAPDHAAALTNLASLVARRSETDEAERLLILAIGAAPGLFDAYFNLGNLYRKLGRHREATAAFEEALRIAPDSPQALVNLGLAVSDDGNWPRAVEAFARAATVAPHLPEVLNLLGDALAHCGRLGEAVAAFRESVARFPDSPRALYNLGLHLTSTGAAEEAIGFFERALALQPDYAEAHNALGIALDSVGRADDAQRAYREAVRLRPDFVLAKSNLGVSLGEQGRVAEAIETLRAALAMSPSAATGSALLTNLLFSAEVTGEQLRGEHIAWAEKYAKGLAPAEPPRKRAHDAPGRVRVGYVFADFRSRAAAGLLEALLAYHDRTRFHVTAYASAARQAESDSRLRRLADTWRPVTRLTDEQLAAAIRADEIDILADLSGHAPGNRLLALARKPSATQVSLFGHPATTGLAAMDFRVTDAVTDPPGAEALYVEKLLRLPDLGWAYAPPAEAPEPNALPAAGRRSFTFGCLNHPGKLSEPCVEAWAAILKAVPKSRLVLLAGHSVAGAEALAARFTRHGVASDRLELVYRLPVSDYFAAYQPIDLALDPFPYNGAVTTCDALWMGVPVLTLAGREARARLSVAILTALGLPEFVADSPEQFVSLAATWADQRESLSDVRKTLREMMAQSPVTAVTQFVKHLEAAFLGV
jgi:predicted O-linked N-acetylglucosamine transferase (SPINDLY family)